MRTVARVGVVATTAALGLGMLAGPAVAKGAGVGGTGAQYFLNDSFNGSANTVFSYGEPGDDVYIGDWDSNGTSTPMIRRGNTFYVRNSNSTGAADTVFSYGDAGDTVLVGDWNGDGTDTLAVRRANTFYVKNSTTTGVADTVFSYGDRGDAVLVGDWDGDGTDTLVVRRGGQYFVKNDLNTGAADRTFYYGDPGDTVLVGHWSADQVGDSLGVRRGGTYYLRNSLTSGPADRVFGYGDPTDTAFVGDWNGDGVDTLGVRRPPPPPLSRDFISKNLGQEAGILNGDGSPWITFTVDSITRDPACTRDTRQPPTSGHFVAVAVTVTQVGPTPAGESPFSMYYGDWHVVSSAGVRDNDNNTFPAYTCLTDAQKLPYTDLQQGITLRGVIVLDTAQTSGHVTYTPSETAPQGWDWRF
jgi:hypothetical protein